MTSPKYEWPNRQTGSAYTLPSRYFYDPQIMEDEKWAIFYKNWLLVGHISEFAQPRQFVTYEILDQLVLIVRGDDGELLGIVHRDVTPSNVFVSTTGEISNSFRAKVAFSKFLSILPRTKVPRNPFL